MRISPRTGLLIAIFFSLFLVHAPLFYFVLTWRNERSRAWQTPPAAAPTVVVDLVPSSTLPIADIDKPANEAVPDKATAQALYNSKVKEETVATGRKQPTGTPEGQPHQPQPAIAPKPIQKPEKIAKVEDKKSPPVPAKTPEPAIPNGKALTLADEIKSLKAQTSSKLDQTLTKLTTQPSPVASSGPRGGPSGDYIPGIKIGNHTYLNALANPRIGYFVELKRKFEFTWNPVPVLRRNLNQISRGEIRVVWGVTVNGSGQLKDVKLITGSGLAGYDDEARRAITASAPFSRPPEGLKENDGNVYMAWTFVYYL